MTTGASALPLARGSSGSRVTSPWTISSALGAVNVGAEVSCTVDVGVGSGAPVNVVIGVRVSSSPAMTARRIAMTTSRTITVRRLCCPGVAPVLPDGPGAGT